jgi:hypothetical protein
MYAETFLTKIALTVLKSALMHAGVSVASSAIDIHSVFHPSGVSGSRVAATSTCGLLDVYGLEIVSDVMATTAAEVLLRLGQSMFVVDRTDSGVYVASDVAPTFRAPAELALLHNRVCFDKTGRGGGFSRLD